MPDIFISYKRENQPFAETLREKLLAWGHSVWMDVYDIPKGAYWPDAIDDGLNGAHTIIGIISPDAVQSRNVKNEWDWAIVNGRRLLLIMLEDSYIPMNYVSINYIDATTDHAAAFESLRDALDTPADPPAALHDPYLPYLRALYDRINTALAQKIIKISEDREPQPIDLVSRRTDDAVAVLFEQRQEVDPLFAAMGIAEDAPPDFETGDFRDAFEFYGGHVLLLGDPGAGKTITLLHFGRDAVVQRIQHPDAPLPILALIPTWDASTKPPLSKWIAESYGAPNNAQQVIAQGRALLLLDGLDELGTEREDPETKEKYDPRERFVAALANLPENQVIVTCRVADYAAINAKIALNGAVTLQNLSDAQMQHYLDEMPDLWAALQTDDGLREIARTPLLLSFFAFAYRDMTPADTTKLQDLTDSPGELRDVIFARYVSERYAHEQRKLRMRGEEMQFTLGEAYSIWGRVASQDVGAYWKKEDNMLELRQFGEVLNADAIPVFIEFSIQLHILSPQTDDSWRFIHLLLRDFFVYRTTLPFLQDEEASSRMGAANTLGRLGDVRAVEPLIAILADMDDGVRNRAADALGWLKDTRAVEPLIITLRDPYPHVRSSVIAALGVLRDARAVEPLIAALTDTDRDVRNRAIRALGILGDKRAIEPLAAILHDSEDFDIALALGRLGDKRGMELFITALNDDDSDTRRMAAYYLRDIGDKSAVEPLIATLTDPDIKVREMAVVTLGYLGDARAIEPIIAAEHPEINSLIYIALGQLGYAPIIDGLIETLSDVELEDSRRSRAANRLGIMKSTHAVAPLIVALHDHNDDVNKSAAEALTAIGTPEALAAVEAWRASQKNR